MLYFNQMKRFKKIGLGIIVSVLTLLSVQHLTTDVVTAQQGVGCTFTYKTAISGETTHPDEGYLIVDTNWGVATGNVALYVEASGNNCDLTNGGYASRFVYRAPDEYSSNFGESESANITVFQGLGDDFTNLIVYDENYANPRIRRPARSGEGFIHHAVSASPASVPQSYIGSSPPTNEQLETPGALTPDGRNDGAAETVQGEELAETCESRTPGWGWLLCSGLDLIDGMLTWTDNQIQRLLEINEDRYNNDALKSVWSTLRNLSYLILIPIMLVMVIGTAVGVEVFSAYTVKRALPRMVIAVIFIALSWYICIFLIGLFNAIGAGTVGLVTAPFREHIAASEITPACADGSLNLTCLFSPETEAAGGAGILRGIATTFAQAGLIVGLVLFLAFFGWTLALAAATAFLVLFAREMFILGLMLMAPLAILAWIFPGNDKLWKMWWNAFSKLLMMFPLIMGIIALGRIFAWIINESPGGALDGSMLQPIMKLVAYMLPYAFIPFAFKFVGGVLGNLAGFINDKERGLFDRAAKKRQEKFQRGLGGNLIKGGTESNLRGKVNKAFGAGANVATGRAGINPAKWRGRVGSALSNSSISQRDAMLEDDEYKSWKGYDQLNRAAAASSNERTLRKELEDSREYHTDTGRVDANGNKIWELTAEGKANMERDIARVESMRRKYGNSAMRQAAYIQALAGGTATDVKQKNGKTYSALELAASIAGTDRAVQAELVAKGRSAAGQAGRIDQSGMSFGDGMGEIDKFLKGVVDVRDAQGNVIGTRAAREGETGRQYTAKESREAMLKKVYDRQGAGAIMHPGQKSSAVEALAPVVYEQTQDSFDRATSAGAGHDEHMAFIAQLASAKAIYEGLNSTNPDKARIVQREVTSKTLDVSKMTPEMRSMFSGALAVTNPDGSQSYRLTGTITYTEALKAVEGNPEFQQFRREFENQFRAQATSYQAAQAAASAAQQQGPQAGPPPAGPQVP